MLKNSAHNDRDREFDRKIKYYQLLLAKWEIEYELRHEYPEETFNSHKRFAKMYLNAGLIKCKHEK